VLPDTHFYVLVVSLSENKRRFGGRYEVTKRGLRLTYDTIYLALLAPWCRIFFEKSIVTQLVEQLLAFFMEPEVSLPCS